MPAPPGSPSASTSQDGPGGITLVGEGLTPEAQEAFAEWTKAILADAIHRAVQDGADQLARELNLSDDEQALLFGTYDWGGPDADGDALVVRLVRPGEPGRPPEAVEVSDGERLLVRLTRTWAPVPTPVAVMTRCRMDSGRLILAELSLTYGPDGRWRAVRPAVRRESLRPGDGR